MRHMDKDSTENIRSKMLNNNLETMPTKVFPWCKSPAWKYLLKAFILRLYMLYLNKTHGENDIWFLEQIGNCS